MKRVIITIGLAVLMFSGLAIAAEDRYFYESGKILPGEQWADVYVYNDSTVVDMNGGLIDGLGAFDASTVNISGGQAYTVEALEFSTINVTGGYVYGLNARDNAFVNFMDDAQAGSVIGRGNGTINMNGGQTDYLNAAYNSTINLQSGTISDSLNAWDLSTVNIYSNNFIYDPIGGDYDGGQLRGFYLNGSPLLIDLYDTQTYEHINFVPEPVSFLLFGFGALALRRKR